MLKEVYVIIQKSNPYPQVISVYDDKFEADHDCLILNFQHTSLNIFEVQEADLHLKEVNRINGTTS